MKRQIIILVSIVCLSFVGTQTDKDKVRFVEISGKKQYYLSKGVGNPVVVFVTGLGPTMDDFFELQNEISKTIRTFCYDRGGIGKSEPLNNERNLENIANELKRLLDKVGLDKPLILVGHSRGGIIARYFTKKYPDRICGLILLDPAIPEFQFKKRALRTEKEKIEFDNYYNSFCIDSVKYSAIIRNEFKNTFTSDSAAIADKNFPLNIPITIIGSSKLTKDKYSKDEINIKVALLTGYLKTAPRIKLILTDKSGHYIYDDEPKLVINEIVTMVNKVKTSGGK